MALYSWTTHTIYYGTSQPAAPQRQTTVGITILPTPSITAKELQDLIAELQQIHDKMQTSKVK